MGLFLLQNDFFEPDMLLILERFSCQYHYVVYTQNKVPPWYKRAVIAQYDSDDNPLGQMELGYTLFHPWIAGGQVDFDKVYVGFLTRTRSFRLIREY